MKLLGKAILIKPDKMPERTPSGQLIIPRTSKEMLPEEGEIIDVGPACKLAAKGSRVRFHRGAMSVASINGEDYYFTYEYKVIYHG